MPDRIERPKNSRLEEHDNIKLNRRAESRCDIPYSLQNDSVLFIGAEAVKKYRIWKINGKYRYDFMGNYDKITKNRKRHKGGHKIILLNR